jgi:hypothetical protein
MYVDLLGKLATQKRAGIVQYWQMGLATALVAAAIVLIAVGTPASFLAAFALIGGGLAVLVPEHAVDIMKQVVEMTRALRGTGRTNGHK